MVNALLLIVRRGAQSRFDALKKKAEHLRVVLAWDRRQGDRRQSTDSVGRDGRRGERRRQPPFTWEVADFLVAGETTPGDDRGETKP
jgi:hypothetical protein